MRFGFAFEKVVNISFEPEFENPRFLTPEKLNVFNFLLTRFSAEKPGLLNLFLSYLSFMLSSKIVSSNTVFQNSDSNPI